MENVKEKTVLFDPGYAQHTTILSISSEYIYNTVNQFKNFGQKKMKFKMLYPQITRMVDNNVGFCLGCLLWAVYIKGLGDAKIEGNPCLGDTYNKEETVDVILPEGFEIPSEENLEKIHSKIQEVIASGNLLDLTEVFELAYKG